MIKITLTKGRYGLCDYCNSKESIPCVQIESDCDCNEYNYVEICKDCFNKIINE